MGTTTIIQETKQVITNNAIYDLTISKTDGVVNVITAEITAQISTEDERGGHTLSAEVGAITQTEKGITIDGTIPSDMLSAIVTEFINITNEIKQ